MPASVNSRNVSRSSVNRLTVDLSQFPDLVVVYLGMRVNRIAGLKTLFGFGPQISKSVAAQPPGLLRHENFILSLFPMHAGMRQYWHDMDSLLTWTRSDPHREWWRNFLRDSGGTGFWHETYTMRGGMEAIYDDISSGSDIASGVKIASGGDVGPRSGSAAPRLGFMAFAPVVPARGSMFTAAHRTGLTGPKLAGPKLGETGQSDNLEPVVSEKDLYDK